METRPPAPPRYLAPDTAHTAPSERVEVAFAGEGGGRGPLAWGQAAMWAMLVEQGSWIPMGGTKPMPAGTTVDDVAAELRYLVGRYQPMRTRLVPGEGDVPAQAVHDRGSIALEVVDAAGREPGDVAEATFHRIADAPLDLATEWPLRMAVVRDGGAVTHMAVAISHLVADAVGTQVMMREAVARPSAPVTGLQPLAQAAWQCSPAGRRQDDAAARYWETQLRAMPATRPDGLGDARDPRYWQGRLRSAALRDAVAAIAGRTGSDSSPVLLALYAVAVARVTGTGRVVLAPTVGNRFRPGLADVVAVTAQRGLCTIEVGDAPFDTILDRVRRASLAAYKYAYYDPERMRRLTAAVERERGPAYALTWHVNDRRADRSGPAHPAAPADIRAAAAKTAFAWTEGRDAPYEPVMVHVDSDGDALALTVTMDTRLLSAGRAEALLRWMEEVAIGAAGG